MNGWPVDLALLGSGRWRGSLGQRCGLRIPPVQPGSVWVHAASLGEAGIARRLVDAAPPAFATADTASGILRAGAARPVDHPWTLAPLWAEARPRALVFVEGAWWPGLVRLARRDGVPVWVVAARPSSTKRLLHRLTGAPDRVYPRDAEAVSFYADICETVAPVGSLKGGPSGGGGLQFEGTHLVGVCTHAPEEEALIHAWRTTRPEQTLLLAPRRLERIHALRQTFGGDLRSQLHGTVPAGSLVWLDRFGELSGLLPGAGCAFVGGTFDPALGGHSPAEALAAGVPVVHGPQIRSNRPSFVGTLAVEHPEQLGAAIQQVWGRAVPRPSDGLQRIVDDLRDLPMSPAASPRPWARPLTGLQRARLALRRRHHPLPAIGIGSSNARGAGKTSLCAFVAEGLIARGLSVAVLTRGVGARIPMADSAHCGPCPWHLGDEGARLAARGLRVLTGPADRTVPAVDVLLLEDGLQRRPTAFSIATVDGRFPRARGPFPAGEDRSLIQPPDLLVWLHAPAAPLAGRLVPGPWNRPPPGPGAAFASLGRPVDFFDTVQAVRTRAFPNHHRYSPDDRRSLLAWADGLPLLTTTRDALRLPGLDLHHRDVSLEVPDFPWDHLLDALPERP